MAFFLVMVFADLNLRAQDPALPALRAPADTLRPLDNVQLPRTDTLMVADTTVVSDSTSVRPRGDINTTVKYFAKDSIVMDRANEIIYLFGDAKVNYGDIQVEGAIIVFDQKNSQLSATSRPDSAGKPMGKPVFTEGQTKYETEGMQYNFKTQRAITSGLVTEQNQGFLHGEEVYKNEQDELYVNHAKYTTCNLAHPHFEIRSKRLKRAGRNVISGPFNLYINDVPTPLGLPFGMFPDPETRTSGIIVPSYGEERQRGFFLRDGGYYFDINEYVNLRLTGEVYTKGGWGIRTQSDYRKRYAYQGGVNFNITKRKTGLEGQENEATDFSLTWRHAPVSKGNSRFTGSVNAANQNNNLTVQQNINANLNSSVSYSKTFVGTPFNMTLSARHNQNLTTNIVDVTLPEMSVNMNRQSPFKRSKVDIIKNFNFSWNANLRNRVTNAPTRRGASFDIVNAGNQVDDTLDFNFSNLGALLENAENGARHQVPISTSQKLFRYFTISPNINITELWYLKKLNYTYDPELQGVRIDTLDGFTRATTYTTGASLSTRLYGTFSTSDKSKKIQAIRHTLIPSLSFGYTPDFTDPSFDYFQEVRVDSAGNTQLLSRYNGFVFGSPAQGNSGSIGFTLQNTLEMKVRTKNDSTSEDNTKKVHILRNLSFSTSYNLRADSFNLSDFRISATTSILDNLIDFSAGMTIDPYIYEITSQTFDEFGQVTSFTQRQVDRFAWNNGRGIGQITTANFALNTRLDPNILKGDKSESNPVTPGAGDPLSANPINPNDPNDITALQREAEVEHILHNPNQYLDFKIPWSLRLQYTLRYSKVGFRESSITQSLNFSGDLSLSEKWKLTYSSGYDFERKEFTQTRLGA